MAYKNLVSHDVIGYKQSLIHLIGFARSYGKMNFSHVSISDRVDLGDGEYFIDYLRCSENRRTGTVSVSYSISSRLSGPIHPSHNCGKIDLDNIPTSVLLRYTGYFKSAESKYSSKRTAKRRLLRKAKSRLLLS